MANNDSSSVGSALALRPVGGARAPLNSHHHASLVVEPSSGDVLLAISRREGTQLGVWRLRNGQVEAIALGHEAVGFSPTDRPTHPHLYARRDGTVGALWQVYGPSSKRHQIETTWDGARFVQVVAPLASSIGYGSTLFDPGRDTLVTFLPGAAYLPDAQSTFEETTNGTLEQKKAPVGVASYSQNIEGCFSTRLGRLVYLGRTPAQQLVLETWDGSRLVTLPWRSPVMPSFSSPRLVDGAPFGADVVVIAGKQWFAVNESSAEEPRSLPAEPSWWAWTVDAARRLLWVAATEQGDLFGTLHPEGTRPVAGHVWGRFIRSAARSPESLVVAEFHRPAVVLGPDGQQSERVLPEAELIAALPDGALLAFSRQKITLVSRTGESSPVPRPDDWMDEAHTALVAEDGAVHVLGISEGATREAIHQRFDGTSWSAVAEGPRAALAGRLVGADAGQGRLVAVQSRMEKPLGAETLWFDGAWRSEPLRLGPGWRLPPGHNPWEPFVKAVGRDPATGHLLLVAVGAHGPVLAVYAAEGFWKVVASLAMQTPGATAARGLSAEALSEVLDCAEFGLRAADRSVVMVGATGDCSGASWRLEGSFGALLDALPAPGKIPVPELNVPPPAFHALVKREEGSQKFWTATVEGATCTIAWGKRGAKGQSKSSLAKTAARAQADAAKKAEEKLAEGYEVVPEGPEVARSGARQSFPFTRGETEPTAGNALGNPEIAGGPTCSTCDRPMSLVIQLARHPERLPLRKHAGLAIWVCVTTSCRPWQRDGGANAAQLLGEDAAVPSGARAIAFETSVMEQEGGAEDEPPPARSHLGGFPVWIQDEDRPLCDVCSDPMAFALQIDGHDAEHNFGDDGSGYAFVCPRECSAKFLSQSC